MALNTVGDLIGALQRHSNSSPVKVNGRSILNVIAPNTKGSTVNIYTVNEPTTASVSLVSGTQSGPIRLEED